MAAENEKYVSTALEQVVLRKVEEFLENFLNQLKSNEEASSKQQGILLSISSVAEEGFRLSLSNHTKVRCAFVIRVLAEVYGLIVSGKYSTKRDIFYQNKALFGKQSNLNRAVTTVCQLLNEPRVNLHLLSTARGCIFGDLQFINKVGTEIDCRQHPVLISSHFESIEQVKSDARFVLVVEKDATFVKLCDEKLVDLLGPCIMITGKGYPDISTRRVLKALLQHLHGVPVFGLMDSDPHGLEILLTYKFGAQKATAENRNLSVNDIRWIGLHRSDISSMPIMPDQFLPLQAGDIRKIGRIQKRIYRLKDDMLAGESGASLEEFDQMTAELRLLEQSGTKLELEAVSGLRPSYMTRVYLRKKIEDSLRQQPPNWAEKDFSLSEGDEEVDGKDDLSLSADESNEDEDWSRDLIVENASVVLGEKGRNVMSGPLKSMAEQDII